MQMRYVFNFCDLRKKKKGGYSKLNMELLEEFSDLDDILRRNHKNRPTNLQYMILEEIHKNIVFEDLKETK